jgi:hypothetical protein
MMRKVRGTVRIVGRCPSTESLRDVQTVAALRHLDPAYVRFSNRPTEVKRFQTIRRHGLDVARGLVLLFGIGTTALPSWDSKTRGSI